eukprot:1228221-Rhodomonas_salina.1
MECEGRASMRLLVATEGLPCCSAKSNTTRPPGTNCTGPVQFATQFPGNCVALFPPASTQTKRCVS